MPSNGNGVIKMSETKVNLVEVEVNKLSLQPGDVLLAKVAGEAFKDEEVCNALAESMRKVFPNNRVGVLYLEGNQIDLTVISQEQARAIENAIEPEKTVCKSTNVCDDCSCGKAKKLDIDKFAKEVMEENKELFEDLAKLEKLEKEQLKKEENGN